MKQIKRLAALALAVMMLLSVAITASAAEGDTQTYSVTIENATGHTYKIYQIFTGDLSKNEAGKDVLANIEYGEDYGTEGDVVPEEVLNNFNPANITPTGDGKMMTTTGSIAKIEGLVAGYYMIVDVATAENMPDGEAPSAVIFQVVENTTVSSKHPTTTIIKKVQDINDSTGVQTADTTGSTWIDSADYDINDTVPFKSTATFNGLSNYESYKVIFTDIMAKGLKYEGGMKVLVNDVDKTTSFTIASSAYSNAEDTAYNGGTQITVTCDDILPLLAKGANSATIVLEYSAKLTSDAKLGAPGNPNKIKVTTKPDGTGETPWDVNIVFTYKLETNKYADEVKEGNELEGAGFTLYKWIKNDTEAGGSWVQIGEEVTGTEMTKFEWKGIDDGKYKIEETTTPAGYNTIDPIEFEVAAEHVIVADNPSLTSLTGEASTGEVAFKAIDEGLSTDVVNKSGTVLPETGGIGTTIFYIAGGLMVLVAVVLLVTKKRMSTAE